MKTTVTEVNAKFLHQPHEDALQPGGGARLVDPAVQEVIVWNVDESWAIDWIRCEFAALAFTQIFYRILPLYLLLKYHRTITAGLYIIYMATVYQVNNIYFQSPKNTGLWVNF